MKLFLWFELVVNVWGMLSVVYLTLTRQMFVTREQAITFCLGFFTSVWIVLLLAGVL